VSNELFIILQGALAFGAPLTLAVIELVKLRRTAPRPVGGGDPNVVAFTRRQGVSEPIPPAIVSTDRQLKRAA
jgi:hypothetical protein